MLSQLTLERATQSTSIDSYRAISHQELSARQMVVLACLREHENGICNRHLAELLDREINTITPRVKELREMGLVEQAGTVFDEGTKRMVLTWRTVR